MADDHETLHSEAPDQSDGGERPVDRSGGARSPEDAPARSGPPTVWLLVLLGILLLFVWQYFKSPKNFGSTVDYSFFLDQLEAGNVKEVEIIAPDLIGRWKKVPENPKQAEDKEAPPLEERFNTVISTLEDRTLIDLLHEKDVSMSEENQSVGLMGQMLIYLFPLLIILAVFFFFMRRSADPFSSGMFGNFVRSPAKRFRPTENRTSFDDVAGMEHAKRELQEVVEFLK
ncbi:MAG: cell division protein FtsH, partial [Planctomycetota bacterium]